MAFKATLDLEGTNYVVEACNFSLGQETDYRYGKPTSQVSAGEISLELRVDGDKLKELWIWGKEHDMKKGGTIKFFKIDEDASLFELKFEDGFCTSFAYNMTSHGSSDMTVSIHVSAKSIEVAGEKFELNWEGAVA
ncbi:MAG: type VI secretion system tube protein TssD [Bacteroidota bacterium]